MPDKNATAGPSFGLYRLRFRFRATDSVYFPEGQPGNIIRGAFGTILRRIACTPDCTDARSCPRAGACPYARIFEPGAQAEGPSGLVNWPRPFVFRAYHLNGQTIRANGAFHFDVHLFDRRGPLIPFFILAFSDLAKSGLGPGRGRAMLIGVDEVGLDDQHVTQLYDGVAMRGDARLRFLAIPLTAAPDAVNRLRVEFLSPTELKHEGQVAPRPEFGILFGRIRDRIATLTRLYGAGPLALDFAAMGARASAIHMTSCDIRQVDVERLSSRTGQHHPIGGFSGTAEYEGELAEFVPWVRAATYCGVGRQTTFGNGEIRMSIA